MAASLPGISPPKLRSLVEIMLSTPRTRLGHQCKARFAGNGRILTKKCNAAVVGLGRPNVNIISTRLISHRLSGPLQIMAEHKLSDQVWVTKTLTQIPPLGHRLTQFCMVRVATPFDIQGITCLLLCHMLGATGKRGYVMMAFAGNGVWIHATY
jgi:hypothetical protein